MNSSTFDQVQQKCGVLLSAYQSCLTTHPREEWGSACSTEQKALSKCASEKYVSYLSRVIKVRLHHSHSIINSVDSVKLVRQKCKDAIAVYESCVERHESGSKSDQGEIHVVCGDAMRSLEKCIGGVVGESSPLPSTASPSSASPSSSSSSSSYSPATPSTSSLLPPLPST